MWIEEGFEDIPPSEAYPNGRSGSGFRHILQHLSQFQERWGIAVSEEELLNIIVDALKSGTVVGKVGKGGDLYEGTLLNGQSVIFAIVVGENGYIVTAYPQ